ncbi:MAG: hypothetical protein KIT31_34790, partial [Deltaproteobacteria bacterium]|nr:hypothetical protein [Deltaproteobacteria bacterium]
RVTGHYLYQLSSQDWFDGTAVFTFGSAQAACFRDRADAVVCNHGLADGTGLELSAGVRRMFAPQGRYQPFARAAVGFALMRFGGDEVTGAGIPLHLGGGIRARVSKDLAVVANGELLVGFAAFNRNLGVAPQIGLAITAGAEFRL